VLAPVGGMVLGVGGGLGVAALYEANVPASESRSSAWLLGPFIGAFAGASVGALAIGLPFDFYAQIDDEDRNRRVHAEADLAAAANARERAALGLPLADAL